jgi:uncharacterized membrane protein
MSTSDNFFNADGSRFNAADDTLELTDFTIAAALAVTIEQALLRGFLTPTDLDGVPCAFEPHATYGALLCASIPEAPWKGIRGVGTSAAGTAMETRKAKKQPATHKEPCLRRTALGKSSGSPKRDR